MTHLVAILIPLTLLAGFLLLAAFERRSNKRIFARRRYLLDQKVGRTGFVLQHVDWGAFAFDLTRSSVERAAHDIAHTSLLIVRALERLLTRFVRRLRASDTLSLPQATDQAGRIESAAEFVKQSVRRSRKAIKDTLHR